MFSFLLALGVMVVCISVSVHGSSLSQKAVFEDISTLRDILANEITETYMKEDYYLENWLQYTNYNIDEAVDILREYLQWRKKEKMSHILAEDWTDMRKLFPYFRDTSDKEGRPVLYLDSADWKPCSFLANSDSASDRLARYILMFLEETEVHIRQLRAEGLNVTKFTYVSNLANFNPLDHISLKCLAFYKNMRSLIYPFYTRAIQETVYINAPYIYKSVFQLLPYVKLENLRVFGQDRKEWENALLEIMDKSQFPGGILKEVSELDNADGLLLWHKEL